MFLSFLINFTKHLRSGNFRNSLDFEFDLDISGFWIGFEIWVWIWIFDSIWIRLWILDLDLEAL